ncbi:MAG: cation transporter, partial [Bacilli bacterium]
QAEKPSDERMTIGYYRTGILAALINGISLMLITLWILWEAFQIREGQSILRSLEHRLAHLGIGHVTIQMEDADHPHGQSELCAVTEPVHEH